MSLRISNRFLLSAFAAVVCTSSVAGAAEVEGGVADGVTEAVLDVTLSLSVPGILWREHLKEGDLVHSNEVILELEHRFDDLECMRRKLVADHRKNTWEATKTVFEKSQSVSQDELNQTELDYQVAKVEYEMAERQVEMRQLRAPFKGVLVDLRLDPGEASEAYEPLARIVDVSQCYFISNLDFRVASRLHLGQAVKLVIDDETASDPVAGKVVFVSPVVDPASGLQEVKVLFENPHGAISPGVSGRLLLP